MDVRFHLNTIEKNFIRTSLSYYKIFSSSTPGINLEYILQRELYSYLDNMKTKDFVQLYFALIKMGAYNSKDIEKLSTYYGNSRGGNSFLEGTKFISVYKILYTHLYNRHIK